MGIWRKTRTNTGHKAGKNHGRWTTRESAKYEARKLRRALDRLIRHFHRGDT